MDYVAFQRARRAEIEERIAAACAASGRTPDEILLVAVSKTVGIEEVAAAREAGYAAFAENRPQELKRKLAGAADHPVLADARWDMIGHLQTKKDVVGRVALIHSVDTVHLAQAIDAQAAKLGIRMPVLMEVNIAGEESKSGFDPASAREGLDAIASLGHLDLAGLMGMAPAHDPEAARRAFSGLRALRDALAAASGLPLRELSCGMSDDFTLAIEEGSTIIRLGRTVFDPAYVLQ